MASDVQDIKQALSSCVYKVEWINRSRNKAAHELALLGLNSSWENLCIFESFVPDACTYS